MKDIDNIEDWYRDELNNYNVEPDKNLWDSLSGNLDSSTPLTDETISDWYKNEVSKLEENPDYTVWEKLATQLDTASVWDKLAVSLNRYDQLVWLRNIAIRGTAVFLLCFGSYLAYNNYSFSSEELATNNPTESEYKKTAIDNNSSSKTEEQTIKHKNIDLNQDKKTEEREKQSTQLNAQPNSKLTVRSSNTEETSDQKIRATIKNAKKEIINKQKETANNKQNGDEVIYASKEKITRSSPIHIPNLEVLKSEKERTIFTEINRRHLTEKDISHLLPEGEYLVKKDNDKIVFNSKRFSSYSMFGIYARRVYAGFNIGVKKQGILSEIKKDSQLSGFNQNSFLDFGTSFGGTAGYILSDNINIEANININSTAGYKRTYEAEGIAYREDLNLNYTTINLLAKKMNNKSTFDNKVYSTNIIGGAYVSYLRSVISNTNGIEQKEESYNNTDYGFVLGIEQDRYITKTLVITPGIRYNQGISNTSNPDSPFKSTRNFSFEFNLGVKYIFLKKGK